jgi:hypothetical protein
MGGDIDIDDNRERADSLSGNSRLADGKSVCALELRQRRC